MQRSASVIVRAFMMYKPLKFFSMISVILLLAGGSLGVRFVCFYLNGLGDGHVQSLILAAVLLLMGFQAFGLGLIGDIVAANRKLLEDVQYRVRKMEAKEEDTEQGE